MCDTLATPEEEEGKGENKASSSSSSSSSNSPSTRTTEAVGYRMQLTHLDLFSLRQAQGKVGIKMMVNNIYYY
jgi:hypothetical protein